MLAVGGAQPPLSSSRHPVFLSYEEKEKTVSIERKRNFNFAREREGWFG
jgi:hypothetical protein